MISLVVGICWGYAFSVRILNFFNQPELIKIIALAISILIFILAALLINLRWNIPYKLQSHRRTSAFLLALGLLTPILFYIFLPYNIAPFYTCRGRAAGSGDQRLSWPISNHRHHKTKPQRRPERAI